MWPRQLRAGAVAWHWGDWALSPHGHHPQSKSPRHSGDSSAWQFLHPASGHGTGMLREGTHGAAGWGGSST